MTSNTLRVENCSHCTTPSELHDNQLVSVKVGCLHINLATERGRRTFMLQMLVLCFVPHAALIIQNCSVMAKLSETLDASLYLQNEVSMALSVGDAVVTIAEERLQIAKFLLSSHSEHGTNNRTRLQRAFIATDLLLSTIASSILPDRFKSSLYNIREHIITNKNTKKSDVHKRLPLYAEINSILLLYVSKYVKSSTSSLWRQLSACYVLLKAIEEFSLGLSSTHMSSGRMPELLDLRMQHEASGIDYLETTIQYLQVERLNEYVGVLEEILNTYKSWNTYKKRNESYSLMYATDATRTRNGDNRISESEWCLVKLEEVQAELWNVVRESVRSEVWVARRTLAIGVIILAVVVLASPVLVILIRHTVNTIQIFNRSIEVSTQRLVLEKQKSDMLLSRMLPTPVLKRLRAQRTVPAEAFDAVTIFFSDIVGFTTLSATSTPMEIINMLNMLYRLFDEKIMLYNVYKVETIGDAYMVVSGLPQRNGNKHASEIADMSLSLMRSLEGARVPHRLDEPLRVRAGVNTGPCVAGVVGTTMPRYCLFGDTINVASRMESTGEAMKIQISDSTKKALDTIGGYETESRGIVDVAGKGSMETFWLVGKIGGLQAESPRGMRLRDYDQNILEMLIRAH